MKNTTAIIRNFLVSSFALLLISTSVFAAPVVRTSTGTGTSEATAAMMLFRQDLGGAIHPSGGSYTSGRREIDWEDFQYTSGYGGLFQFPYEYYNKIIPRGAVFNTAYEPSSFTTTMNVSTPHQNYPGYVQFRRTSDYYGQAFRTYSGTKMFAPLLNSRFDVSFYIPGTEIPATVSGFGAVFNDVEFYSYITFYDESGKVIHGEHIPESPNQGFSFVGVSFPDGTRIARVDIELGTTAIAAGKPECSSNCVEVIDYAAIDNVIYGEPRAAEHHSSDFDGDGTSDLAVFRPSDGTWYQLNSGTNIFSAVQFGANGDIPVDGDFDGDSRSDFTVFRPSTGVWYTLRSSDVQPQFLQFGMNGDKPVAGDYDRDGITDLAIWRSGTYWIKQSSNGQSVTRQFGIGGDIPIGASPQ